MPPFVDRLLLAVVPGLAARIICGLHRRLQPEVLGYDNVKQLWDEEKPVILAFWHDQLLLMVKGYKGKGAKVLISSSKDGELITRTMRYFNIGAVRGSSNRGGKAAFKAMVDISHEPMDLVITPDGPKGPRHSLKEGIVQLARMSGRSVVPTAFACSHGHRFQSWDRFLLPYPWGKAVYIYGKPLEYGQNETAENFLSRLQIAMDDTNRCAEDKLKEYGLSAI
jgi:lysophospholipid acyltransferase (LPLAT)-like uncharacterized protein